MKWIKISEVKKEKLVDYLMKIKQGRVWTVQSVRVTLTHRTEHPRTNPSKGRLYVDWTGTNFKFG